MSKKSKKPKNRRAVVFNLPMNLEEYHDFEDNPDCACDMCEWLRDLHSRVRAFLATLPEPPPDADGNKPPVHMRALSAAGVMVLQAAQAHGAGEVLDNTAKATFLPVLRKALVESMAEAMAENADEEDYLRGVVCQGSA